MAKALLIPYHHIHGCFLSFPSHSKFILHFNVMMNSIVLWKLSGRFWSKAVGICKHSPSRALVTPGTDAQLYGLGCWLCSSLYQKYLVMLRSRICEGHLSCSTPILANQWSSLCLQGHYHAGTHLSLLNPLKRNDNIQHTKTIYTLVYLGKFRKGPHMNQVSAHLNNFITVLM